MRRLRAPTLNLRVPTLPTKKADMEVDTICAPATPSGSGGVSLVRLSGPKALEAAATIGGAAIRQMTSHTLRLCTLRDKDGVIDQGVVSYYAAPHSYTGEEVVEFGVHGSPYIVSRLLQALLAVGVRMAAPGEFTQRAFLNGKMDLSQAEAVSDLIAAENKASHDLAWRQLRGGVSNEMALLRERLLEFASLVELELDFSEEDVEFADRKRLSELLDEMRRKVEALRQSFLLGNAIKDGISVAIVGRPNAGKSTLLNALLHEERALVSNIPGTTRDTIEETWQTEGVKFRFIDTAGLRQSDDVVEKMGIDRTLEKMKQAKVWLYLFDVNTQSEKSAREEAAAYLSNVAPETSVAPPETVAPQIFFIANKTDQSQQVPRRDKDLIYLSAQTRVGMEYLEDALRSIIPSLAADTQAVILTNARHYEALGMVQTDLLKIEQGLKTAISGDLLAIDIRSALHHLGLITGEILPDDILGNIFGKFCIGK